MRNYDLVILGGGVMGAAAAVAGANSGRAVLLLEQFQPAHKQGSSHGDCRIVRVSYPEPFYVAMARQALTLWDELAHTAGQTIRYTTGEWNCGPVASPQLAELVQNLSACEIPFEQLTATESNGRFPHFHVTEPVEVVYIPSSGIIIADAAVQLLWDIAQEKGATLLSQTRVTAIEPTTNGVTLRTAAGETIYATKLIITAGGWAKQLMAPLGLALPLTVTQEQVAYFAERGPVNHHHNQMPVFLDYHTAEPFYGLPHVYQTGVKVGWHHTGQPIQPDEVRWLDDENLAAVQSFIGRRLPHLDPQTVLERQTCLYTDTPDLHFILDRHPAYPQIVLGCGFSGHGFKFAPLIGEILVDLALEKETATDLRPFALGRFQTQTSLSRRTGA